MKSVQNTKLIVLLSSERSGSNLLRTLLGRHRKIFAPNSPHLIHTTKPIFKYICPLDNKKTDFLCEYYFTIVNHKYHNWNIPKFYHKPYNDIINPRSFLDIVISFYIQKAISDNGKFDSNSFIFLKENNLFDYYWQIKDKFVETKFIYLHRDPRSYFSSWKVISEGFNNANDAARNWVVEQNKCLELIDVYNQPIFKLSYEDLVNNTDGAITSVLEFLNLEADFEILKGDANEGWNDFLVNINKPVQQSFTKKFLDVLSPFEIDGIEKICKHEMKRLGYSNLYAVEKLREYLKSRTLMDKFISKFNRSKKSTNSELNITSTLLNERREISNKYYQLAKQFEND